MQSQGSLSELYKKWEKSILKCLAFIEAYIDFDETETLDLNLSERVEEMKVLINEINQHLDDGRKGEILRNGVKTCIIGQPNVGKSSLFNVLCISDKNIQIFNFYYHSFINLGGRQAAIVTPIEGTTRDTLEVSLNIGGYPLVLIDTAGLRLKTDDIIEKQGINRAIDNCRQANLVIIVADVQKYIEFRKKFSTKTFPDFIKSYLTSMNLDFLLNNGKTSNFFTTECIIVLNKIDLIDNLILNEKTLNIVQVSCNSNKGIKELVNTLNDLLKIM